MSSPAVRVQKLGDQVVRVLANRVVGGEIGPGDEFPSEREICEEFGVSKTVAREVVGRLETMGILDVRHGRRTQVRPSVEWNLLDPLLLDLRSDSRLPQVLGDLLDVRLLLEPEIAARAALKATPEQITRMADVVVRMQATDTPPERFLDGDDAFHTELAIAAGNEVLIYILDSIRELLRASRGVTVHVRRTRVASAAQHEAILRAVASHEPETAREEMRAHLLTVTRNWAREGRIVGESHTKERDR